MRLFPRRFAPQLPGLAWLAVMACSDFSVAAQADPYIPDINGNWTLTLSAFPVGNTAGQNGTCSAAPIELQLTSDETGVHGRMIRGMHDRTQLVCSGFTEAGTQLSGLRDTTIDIPRDSVTGSVFVTSCIGFGGCANVGELRVILDVSNLILSGLNPNERRLGGGLSWLDARGAVRLTGTWSAAAR